LTPDRWSAGVRVISITNRRGGEREREREREGIVNFSEVSQYANPSQQGKNKRKARKKTERERERETSLLEVYASVWRF
jgi:hypothetical protein